MRVVYGIYILLTFTTFVQGDEKKDNSTITENTASAIAVNVKTTTAEPQISSDLGSTNFTTETVKSSTTTNDLKVTEKTTTAVVQTSTAVSNDTIKSTSVKTSPMPTITTKVIVSDTTTSLPRSTFSPSNDHQFDGLSFMGGIILAAVLVAVGVLSWKFYKARTERNYHTL